MKATETTILKFIGGEDKVFIIPPFQRNYEWTIEQCEEMIWAMILILILLNGLRYLF